MPTIPLFITSKWQSRPPVLPIPGYGIVTRPNIGKYFQTGSEYAANWLLKNGYCIVAPFIPGASGTDTGSAPGSGVEPIPEEPVQHQVYLDENSELQLDPPVVTSVPGNGEQVLLNFFLASEPAAITAAIRPITIKMAQELKLADPLDWPAVIRILSDRALEAASKWAQTS
jgi:hypothetical protein